MRACDQQNTHGIARRSSSDSTDRPRRAGREPIGSRPTSSSGRDLGEPLREARGLDQLVEPGARRLVELRGERGEPLGGRGVAALDRGRPGQQRRRGDLLDVPGGDDRVAVAGEDDLALLGELEPAVDRPRGLREQRAVGGAATAAEGTAAAVEEREHDVVATRPLRDAALRGVQRERRGDGPDVLGRVRVAEHDLDPAAVLREPALHLRERQGALEDVDRRLEVRERLEQRDRVDDGRVRPRRTRSRPAGRRRRGARRTA